MRTAVVVTRTTPRRTAGNMSRSVVTSIAARGMAVNAIAPFWRRVEGATADEKAKPQVF
jgi:hypothetical protein